MILYGITFHVTAVDLSIILLAALTYIYPASCLVEIKLFQIVSYRFTQPVAEVIDHLHVQVSSISCRVVGSSLWHCLGKSVTQQL